MNDQKVAAIILAAGGSSRLGRPKQLLDWFGKTFVNQLIDMALETGLDPVVIVTGAYGEEIEQSIHNDDVIVAQNVNWKDGQSSSMQVGVKALNENEIDSLIIFLCDQPQVPGELIEKMIKESQKDELDIVATSVGGKICPPTLFKTRCIEGLLGLQGDQGGRALFKSYKTQILEWQDKRLLQDSDTEEDYLKLKNLYSSS
jgi:molybdenum cofactor cytidylyltransferase